MQTTTVLGPVNYRDLMMNGPRSRCSLSVRFIDDCQRKLWPETFFSRVLIMNFQQATKFQSQYRYQSAHSENGKWPRVKLKKNYVGKESRNEYIENPFRLSKLLSSLRRHIIITTVRSSTGQLEYSFRLKLQALQYYFFENFEIFLIPSVLPFRIRKF